MLNTNMGTGKIPKIIIQFWHDKNTLPDVYKEAMAKNKASNPDFTVIYADDLLVCDLLRSKFYPCLLALYQANKIPASRSDIARLALLYEYGGFYLDTAMELNGSLNALIDPQTEIILLQRTDMPKYQECPEKAHVANGIIGAAPKSEFINWCLFKIMKNLLTGYHNNDVLTATGPVVLNKALEKFDDIVINKLSFKELKNGFLRHLKVPGVRQSWVSLQENGIIDTFQLAELNKMYGGLNEKSFLIGS